MCDCWKFRDMFIIVALIKHDKHFQNICGQMTMGEPELFVLQSFFFRFIFAKLFVIQTVFMMSKC